MKQWRVKTGFECDGCGSDAIEVNTTDESQNMVYDGDEAKCTECGLKGGVCIAEEPHAIIQWD